MTDIEIDEVVKKLIDSPLSSYQIAKKTCITEQTIGNYRKKLTRPTAANAKLLEYFFDDTIAAKAAIIGDNNTMIGRDINTSPDVLAQLQEKDKTIAALAQANAQLVQQLSTLTSLLSSQR